MLLGCCHCDDVVLPPSESSQPSSDSVDSIQVDSSCSGCLGNVTPLRLRMTIAYTGSGGLCCNDYTQGVYILNLRTSIYSGTCLWGSDEKPKQIVSGSCVNWTPGSLDENYLAALYLNYPTKFWRVHARLFYATTFGSHMLEYTDFAAKGTVNCLTPMTLQSRFATPQWQTTRPCSIQSIPSTITIEPI